MISSFFKDIGIDLGTANSLVYLKGRGVVVQEPSIAAVNNKTGQVLAIGEEAKKMLSRTPQHISVIRPLTNGVISDFEMTQEMLRYFLKRVGKDRLFNYRRAVLGIPGNLTEVERKSVEDAAVGAGVRTVHLIEEPVASAIGANLPIHEPTANMVVDIGGGTTEIAIISMGGIVTSRSLKVAGDRMIGDIMQFVRDEFRLAIGEPTAEDIKVLIGSAVPMDGKMELAIRGRDLASGLPREVVMKNHQVRTALIKSLKSITEAIREVIEVSPPELVGDILKNGIYFSGGGSLLRGIDTLVERELGVKTSVVPDPLTCVMRGIGAIIEEFDRYRHVLDNPLRPREIKL
ncbi:MAG: rod shape-determining protein [Candidatus Liptonbacteria bacterium RIFCSPLOWO2_12_FULL_60_15]|uniref:Cell shape-determining protein MreB n=2 Tax=Candidatus Liptoniibacteriota TaxID=1817909 RepID=A0A1G2CJT2_9BACT|nr:MAG: rod shape-determining protein [Candidatus Liptonbacteria bacterium RIFCSPHIGHO2_12_FULL_60_13]OGZ01472.1 MAG: rod shape-determining protein [Candidatus Liptonbacteria bacterium RIFCSPLOWO2_12_FULL_60_15]